MVDITVTGGDMSDEEKQRYVEHIEKKYGGQKLATLNIHIDGEDVDLEYTFIPVPFERIRRITGYLVGSMDHWNNAKRAEERDRVKHSTKRTMERV